MKKTVSYYIIMCVVTLEALPIFGSADVWAMSPADLPPMRFAEIPTDTVADDEEDVYFILMSQADDAIRNSDYDAAAERLNEAIELRPWSPSNALVLSNLGMVYSWLDKDSLSLDAYTKALDIAPSMVTVRNNRGRQLLKMRKPDAALCDFAKVIETDSLNGIARYYHGIISLYSGKLADCEADFTVLRSVEPDSENTSIAMAALYSMTGRDHEAVPYYKRLIELDPSIEYYTALAQCYLADGELTSAGELLDEAFKRYGDDSELLYCRAWLNRERYRLDDARRDAQAAIVAGAHPGKVRALGVLK